MAKVHRNGYFVDFITGMSNGIIVVQDSWIQHAYPAEVCGVSSRVLAPEEMVASKLFVTRRERFDGADIAHIIFALKGNSIGIAFCSSQGTTGSWCSGTSFCLNMYIPPMLITCLKIYGAN